MAAGALLTGRSRCRELFERPRLPPLRLTVPRHELPPFESVGMNLTFALSTSRLQDVNSWGLRTNEQFTHFVRVRVDRTTLLGAGWIPPIRCADLQRR